MINYLSKKKEIWVNDQGMKKVDVSKGSLVEEFGIIYRLGDQIYQCQYVPCKHQVWLARPVLLQGLARLIHGDKITKL